MERFRILLKVLSVCLAILLGLTAGAQAETFTVFEGTSLEDVSLFANLDQHDATVTGAYGSYGCQVVAYTNGLAYLQKAYPSIYGTSLIPDYSETTMGNTAVTLGGANYLNVTVTKSNGNITGAGCTLRDMVWGINLYIEGQAPDRTVYDAQGIPVPNMVNNMPPGGWTATRYQPAWVSMSGNYPTEAFLYDALSKRQALVITWLQVDPTNGQLGGASHLLTVTGLTWDSATNSGTMYYVDPTGGTQRHSPFWQAADGSLWLDYGEEDGVPWTGLTEGQNWWFSGDTRIILGMAEGPAPVPLPATLLLFGSGLMCLAAYRRRKSASSS